MLISITISSKNEKHIIRFLNFWQNSIPKAMKKSASILKVQKNDKKKKKYWISILTSPHINKDAQNHYGYNLFSKNLFIVSYKPRKFFFLFKKIQIFLFPEIKFQINSKISFQKIHQFNLNVLKPYNFTFFKIKKKSKKGLIRHKGINYLKLLDVYGELVTEFN